MAIPILAGALVGGIAGGAGALGAIGIASGIGGALAGGAIGAGVGATIHGTGQAAEAAEEQAELVNEAAQRQFEYNTEMWNMSKDKILADRDHAAEVIATQERNEGKIAAWRDATNLQQYNQELLIHEKEQTSINEQYNKSNEIYGVQVTFNDIAAQAANENEYRKLLEINAESAFDVQEQSLERLRAEGKERARGRSGRSTGKIQQSTMADYGRQVAMINESLESAGRNTRAVLKEIKRDKFSADLAAYAQKMLHPGELPEPIVPFATPMAEFMYPREVLEADYGPAPVLGATMSPSAAHSQVWGTGIAGIAGSAMSIGASLIPG